MAMIEKTFAWEYQIHLLGPFHLKVDGEPIHDADWKSKKALNLLCYLAAHRGKRIPKDQLMGVLWPDIDFDTSLEQNLYTCIYFARRILEPQLKRYKKSRTITYSNGLYCLERTKESFVDTEKFEGLYLEGKSLQKKDKANAISSFKQVIDYYRGDFLSENPYLDWASEFREYYREIYIDAALRLSELLAEMGDKPGAVQVCRDALKRDVYREDLHYRVISYLVDLRRFSEATTQYYAYANMMRDEFGLEPSREALALFRKIQGDGQNGTGPGNKGSMSKAGAFACDREVFESICHLECRRHKRSPKPVTLMMISLNSPCRAMETSYLNTVVSNLRRGDVVCKWDEKSIAVCLWETNELGAKVVSRRLKEDTGKNGMPQASIKYQVIKADNIHSLLEVLQKAR
ncbi:MAG: hypothetical protein GX969_02605 [Firmicutes bacterium]|nr:hypothetical protein [Bacillota bacterium]